MYSVHSDRALPLPGFPIRKSPGQSLFNGSPKLIAVYRVLHRLSLPRHPPYALNSLTIKNQIKSINIQFQVKTYALSMLLPPKLTIHYAIVKEQHDPAATKPPSQIIGGGERVRTDDPLRARQVLSQLSYTPN
jgi:hypothetical protein